MGVECTQVLYFDDEKRLLKKKSTSHEVRTGNPSFRYYFIMK